MKLKCKCGKTLTKDLYPVKSFSYNSENNEYFLKKGSFLIIKSKKYSWTEELSGIEGLHVIIHEPQRVAINKSDVLPNIIPPFIDGYGCCDWSLGYNLKCSCGRYIADLHLDCYEDKTVRFNLKNVDRNYK